MALLMLSSNWPNALSSGAEASLGMGMLKFPPPTQQNKGHVRKPYLAAQRFAILATVLMRCICLGTAEVSVEPYVSVAHRFNVLDGWVQLQNDRAN